MSYTPTNWQTGDVITAEKLNHAEEGIATASNVLLIEASYDATLDVHVLNVTYNEVLAAIQNYQPIQSRWISEEDGVTECTSSINLYTEPDGEDPSITWYCIRVGSSEYFSQDPDVPFHD